MSTGLTEPRGTTLGVVSSMLVNVGVGPIASNSLGLMIASRKGKSCDGYSITVAEISELIRGRRSSKLAAYPR